MTQKQSQSRALPVPSGRLSRLGRLGSMTAGVAGNMALQGAAQLAKGKRPKARDLFLTPGNIQRVADQLANMRGAAMKIGQLMSMDTGDVLPPELARIMARLRDDAHFMPPAQLKKVLNANWPAHWLRDFKSFDVHPIAAASIGQVHRARLKDGRDLAIKVQYPGVARSIDSDVANVGVLMQMSGLVPKGFELAPYLDEAKAQLHEETDYAREGTQMERFRTLLRNDAQFIVPELYPDWSTSNILAMRFIEGGPIEDIAQHPQDLRNRIACDLLSLMLREMFEFGLMQTDPNFANYRYDPVTARIVLLDFGATHQINPAITQQYRRLLHAGLAGDRDAIAAAAKDIGFFDATTKPQHRDILIAMNQKVFDAIRSAPAFDFADNDLARDMHTMGMSLGDDGFLPPPLPMDVLLLQRKFAGMFLLAAKLGAKVDIVALLDRHLT